MSGESFSSRGRPLRIFAHVSDGMCHFGFAKA